jgi:multidrug efflux system membrane fusion protein
MPPLFMNATLRLALGLIGVPLLLAACSKPQPQPEPVRSVRTLVVASAAAAGTQDYAAEIRARTETRLGFRVGGKMVSRSAEVGQRVKAGDVLARLDPEDLRLSQEAARAAVQAAQVNHDISLADFRRFKELRDQGFISGAELERREAALKSAAAQLDQARAQAAVQGNQAAYTTLVAPAAGVVVGVDAEPGTVLAAGTPVLRLALDGPRDVVFAVPEDAVAAGAHDAGPRRRAAVKPCGARPTSSAPPCARWPRRPTRPRAPSWSRPTCRRRCSSWARRPPCPSSCRGSRVSRCCRCRR